MKHTQILTTIAAICICTILQAQHYKKHDANPGGIYISGGANFSNISTDGDGNVDKTKALFNYKVGLLFDLPLVDILSLQSGLYLNGKGAKGDIYFNPNNTTDNYIKYKFNPLYLELPVNAVVKIPLNNGMRLYGGAGPYLAMGIGGKSKLDARVLGVNVSSNEKIKFSNENPGSSDGRDAFNTIKRWDYGMNFLAGVEINRITLGMNYGLGMAKINPSGNDNSNNNNKYRVWTISLGVRL